MIKTLLASVTATVAMVGMAAAQGTLPNPKTSVPEISALEGTAAIAALAAIVLLAWERRRRAA